MITVVSTRTIDRVPDPATGGVREVPGGPATYLIRALERLGCEHRIITGQQALVDVIPGPEGEQYLIPLLEPIPLPARLTGDAVILSPIMQEIDPDVLPEVEGLLILDLQGFVREPGKTQSDVARHFDLTALLRRASLVKASENELARLTSESRDALTRTTLLLTRGASGALVRHPEGEHFVAARPVEVSNTIGAGDTFLAAFTNAMVRGAPFEDAGRQAARFTEQVLRERLG